MNKEEIMKIIPHRDDMLLIEEVNVSADGVAEGKYHVRGDEFFLRGHFPGNPVVPGDTITTECKIVKSKAIFYFCEGKVKVNDKVCVTAEFSFALAPATNNKL